MRYLLVDLGNTRLKWALYQNDILQTIDKVSYKTTSLAQVLTRYWSSIIPPEKIILASVSKTEYFDICQHWIAQHWPETQITIIQASANYKALQNAYAEPSRLGIDRWLNLIAVYEKQLLPALIIDAGTAITIDMIDPYAYHQGGLTLPGIQALYQALLQNTPLSSQILQDNSFILGELAHNPEQGIQWGIHTMLIATIERLFLDYQKHYPDLKCILTGGDADSLKQYLKIPVLVDTNLIFQGLKQFV